MTTRTKRSTTKKGASPGTAKKATAVKAKTASKKKTALGISLDGSKKKKAHRRKNYSNYKVYIYGVLKQVHPEIGISNKGMNVLDSLVHDIINRIAVQGSVIARMNKRQTLGSKEIQTAVRLESCETSWRPTRTPRVSKR